MEWQWIAYALIGYLVLDLLDDLLGVIASGARRVRRAKGERVASGGVGGVEVVTRGEGMTMSSDTTVNAVAKAVGREVTGYLERLRAAMDAAARVAAASAVAAGAASDRGVEEMVTDALDGAADETLAELGRIAARVRALKARAAGEKVRAKAAMLAAQVEKLERAARMLAEVSGVELPADDVTTVATTPAAEPKPQAQTGANDAVPAEGGHAGNGRLTAGGGGSGRKRGAK